MRHLGFFGWLLLVPGLLLLLLLLGFAVLVLSMVPPVVGWVSAGVVVIVAVWLFLGRKKSPAALGSETSLLGRQSSKEGLL
jgi:hypothetical protein